MRRSIKDQHVIVVGVPNGIVDATERFYVDNGFDELSSRRRFQSVQVPCLVSVSAILTRQPLAPYTVATMRQRVDFPTRLLTDYSNGNVMILLALMRYLSIYSMHYNVLS
jgi:hypothetical protein